MYLFVQGWVVCVCVKRERSGGPWSSGCAECCIRFERHFSSLEGEEAITTWYLCLSVHQPSLIFSVQWCFLERAQQIKRELCWCGESKEKLSIWSHGDSFGQLLDIISLHYYVWKAFTTYTRKISKQGYLADWGLRNSSFGWKWVWILCGSVVFSCLSYTFLNLQGTIMQNCTLHSN